MTDKSTMASIVRQWIIDWDYDAQLIVADWAEENGMESEIDAARVILQDDGDEDSLRVLALMEFLQCDPSDISEGYGDNEYEANGHQWLVLTDDEADERCKESIKESVWAFNASFLTGYGAFQSLDEEDIDRLRGDKCEDINDAFLRMIGDDFDQFAEDAAGADGRGHFLSGYDGEEQEMFEFYIYKN